MGNAIDAILSLLDSMERLAVILIGLCLMLMGAYGVYDSYLVYSSAVPKSLMRAKENYGTDESGTGELLESNIAWLTVEGTGIDYPVMQGTDNDEFLNKDPYGNYSLSGSIFLDYRNSPDFSDGYSLIYGHHMAGGVMFGALDRYLKPGYLESHSKASITTKEGERHGIRLFAVMDTDASDAMIFIPGYAGVTELMEYIVDKSAFILPEGAGKGGRIIALSTCKFPDSTERTVVLGVLEGGQGGR